MLICHLGEIMLQKRIKVKDLARAVGVSQNKLIDLKYDRRPVFVSLELLDKLCGVLGCTTSELLEYVAEENV